MGGVEVSQGDCARAQRHDSAGGLIVGVRVRYASRLRRIVLRVGGSSAALDSGRK